MLIENLAIVKLWYFYETRTIMITYLNVMILHALTASYCIVLSLLIVT